MKYTTYSTKSRKIYRKMFRSKFNLGEDMIDRAFDNDPVYKKKLKEAKEYAKSYELYQRSLK